jgi:hypothetical protein
VASKTNCELGEAGSQEAGPKGRKEGDGSGQLEHQSITPSYLTAYTMYPIDTIITLLKHLGIACTKERNHAYWFNQEQ